MSIEDARKARADQSLDKPIRLATGEIVSRRRHMQMLHTAGGVLKTLRKPQPKAEEALRTEVERLSRSWSVPIGNPNHPDTIAFREKQERLRAGIYKDILIVQTPNGVFHEVSKAEADYFMSLGVKP